VQQLRVSILIHAPADSIFDEICDLEARVRDTPAYKRVEFLSRDDNGFVATMYEHYGGKDVVVTSRFQFERPRWVTYEHLQGPYGVNRGRFTIEATAGGTQLEQVHETEQDLAEGSALRTEWLNMMHGQLDAIRAKVETRAASAEQPA
jgi:hypothetical protein